MKQTVLFLCTGNSCRSQMAEGFLRAKAGDHFDVYSAGTQPAERVHPKAVEVMAEKGIDIRQQSPKNVSELLGRLGLVELIVVCSEAEQQCPRIFPGMRARHFWPFDDPAMFVGSESATLEAFRAVRDQIEQRIDTWLKG